MALTQKDIDELLERRHPEFDDTKAHWEFLAATYAGGRAWFDDNIFRYIKEGSTEYSDRVKRAYRFNHSREIVDLVSKYIFKASVTRNTNDAPEEIKQFWRVSTLGGADIKQYIRQVNDKSSIYGKIWVVVDSTKSGSALSLQEEKEQAGDGRIYSYIVPPQHALDMSFDALGELNWIKLYEEKRDDEDPFESEGEVKGRYRIWTRNDWYLFAENTDTGKMALMDSGTHGLGVVPVFAVDHMETDESPYTAPSLIGDIAYLDRAVANYLSNLDAIIQDQTFSQMAMPAQGILPGDSKYNALVEMGTKRIFTYDGEGGAKPFFLSPDPRQAELIITVIKQIINEIYHSVGMAGERTKQDNSMGIDNSSGVAKAYDFERVNALLTSKAGALLRAEMRMIQLVMLWSGSASLDDFAQAPDEDEEELVRYPETFDSRGLYDEFEISSRLVLIDAPDTVRRQQMEQLVDKLFPQLGKDLKKSIVSSLNSWPETEPAVTSGRSALQGAQNNPDTGAQDNGQ